MFSKLQICLMLVLTNTVSSLATGTDSPDSPALPASEMRTPPVVMSEEDVQRLQALLGETKRQPFNSIYVTSPLPIVPIVDLYAKVREIMQKIHGATSQSSIVEPGAEVLEIMRKIYGHITNMREQCIRLSRSFNAEERESAFSLKLRLNQMRTSLQQSAKYSCIKLPTSLPENVRNVILSCCDDFLQIINQLQDKPTRSIGSVPEFGHILQDMKEVAEVVEASRSRKMQVSLDLRPIDNAVKNIIEFDSTVITQFRRLIAEMIKPDTLRGMSTDMSVNDANILRAMQEAMDIIESDSKVSAQFRRLIADMTKPSMSINDANIIASRTKLIAFIEQHSEKITRIKYDQLPELTKILYEFHEQQSINTHALSNPMYIPSSFDGIHGKLAKILNLSPEDTPHILANT